LIPELDAAPERPITPSFNLKGMESSPRFDDPSTPQGISNAADDEEDNLQSLSNVDNMLGMSETYSWNFNSWFKHEFLKDSLPPELDAAPEPPSPPSINPNRIKRSPRFNEDNHESQSNVDNILGAFENHYILAGYQIVSVPKINFNYWIKHGLSPF